MEPTMLDEIARITAKDVMSEHEESVKCEMMIWGNKRNMDRISSGLHPTEYYSFKDLVDDFWNSRIESYGKLRAIRA